jgi:formate hydrogenlyase transcriptional activator
MNPSSEARPDSPFGPRYEMLIRVSQAIKAHRGSDDLFQALAAELHKVVEFEIVFCVQYDEASNQIVWLWGHLSGVLRPDFPAEETMTHWVYERQQSLVVPFLDRETRFPRVTKFLLDEGLQSVCVLPVTTGRRRLGGFGFCSKLASAYSEEEVRFLSLVVDQIALAVDDALHAEELARQNKRLTLLLQLNNAVVSNLHLKDLLRCMSANVRRVMECDGVGVTLPDPESNELQMYAVDAPEREGNPREAFHVPIGGTMAPARAFRTGNPEVVNRIDLRDDNSDIPASVIAAGLKCVCFLPLASRDRVLGLMILGRYEEKVFTQDEIDFLMQVGNQLALAVENALAYREIANLTEKLTQEKLYLEDEIRSEMKFEEIVGNSEALRHVLQQIEIVAPTDSTVLIYGETGTGKELIARALHNLSSRQSNGFVKLNCAAIPTGLLESELFGHERGAFTGAISQRIGRFELAHRGTMFLDEIGEVPLELQPKLLRVLQEREFERLGSTRTLRTDARLIAATNRDLEALVNEQKFRSDLYYRLNVFPLRVPPLRERPEDIPLLVRHFVQQFNRRMSRAIDTIPSETMTTLIKYPWPGNIRELQNVIERAVILTRGPVLTIPSDQLPVSSGAPVALAAAAGSSSIRAVLDDTERKQIVAALEQTNWTIAGPNGAAARLGIKRSTLQSRMQKLGIRISRTRV